MGHQVTGYLPHHRRGPRIDEQRREPGDYPTLHGLAALAYVLGVVALVVFAFGVAA